MQGNMFGAQLPEGQMIPPPLPPTFPLDHVDKLERNFRSRSLGGRGAFSLLWVIEMSTFSISDVLRSTRKFSRIRS